MEGEIQTCTNALITWITSGSLMSWLKGLSLFAVVGAAIATAIAAWYAMQSLSSREKQARATFLLQLDTRWENLSEERKWSSQMLENFTNAIGKEFPKIEDKAQKEKVRERFTSKLKELLDTDDSDYRKFIHLGGFFEIVGLMVDKGYVKLEDITGLLKGPILTFDDAFGGHIQARQKDKHMPPGLFEHAISLAKKTRGQDQKINTKAHKSS